MYAYFVYYTKGDNNEPKISNLFYQKYLKGKKRFWSEYLKKVLLKCFTEFYAHLNSGFAEFYVHLKSSFAEFYTVLTWTLASQSCMFTWTLASRSFILYLPELWPRWVRFSWPIPLSQKHPGSAFVRTPEQAGTFFLKIFFGGLECVDHSFEPRELQ